MKKAISVACLAVSLILDQVTKVWAVDAVKGFAPTTHLWGTFKFIYAENEGAFGGIGGSLPEPWRTWILTVLPCGFLIWLAYHIWTNHKLTLWEVAAYSLIIGGGSGNMIDRIRDGFVVDFLYMGIGPIGTNIFNIADVFIVIGTIMIALTLIQEWQAKKKSDADKEKNSPAKPSEEPVG